MDPIEQTWTEDGKQVTQKVCPHCQSALMYIPAYYEFDEDAEYICLSCDYRYVV